MTRLIAELVLLGFTITLAYGWVLNIITLAHGFYMPPVVLVLRCIGFFMAPLGAVMGLFVGG